MKEQMVRLERQLESLIESSLSRLFGEQLSANVVAGHVARAMADSIKRDDQGRVYAPDQYALTLHPEAAQELLSRAPDLATKLANGLFTAARDCGYHVVREPHVTLAADPTLSPREIRVVAWHSTSPLDFTKAMPKEEKTSPGKTPEGAFLIVDGQRHYPLDRPVINIGRRLDNQLILDDPHVSRTHAQLRLRQGRYVIFDLGSTAGTRVNGRPVKQHILRPGDVISIADVRLVYGEDPGGPPDATPAYTPPFPPRPAGDQRTRTSDWESDEQT